MAHDVLSAPQALGANVGEFPLSIENPAGVLDTLITARLDGEQVLIDAAAYRRSAQVLVSGKMALYNASAALSEALLAR